MHFGDLRTHLLCLTISAINNCSYCTVVYASAFQLTYLYEHGRLFPLDEQAIDQLHGLPPSLICYRLIAAIHQAGLGPHARLLDRAITLALTEQPRPTDVDDARITHLVRVFRGLNAIAAASGIEPDQAPTRLNKDAALKLRYRQLRAASSI
ncbi:MAG: hypothetical protein QOF99_1535 [Pseudonocardiales bacterium]|jgi:hypothetical protein|nr:hypothetical protein [Pseudonocardiales bacterium]